MPVEKEVRFNGEVIVDAIGQTIHNGDFIVEIDTAYAWASAGVIIGGVTKGGQLRYQNIYGRKANCLQRKLIIVTREQFEGFVRREKIRVEEKPYYGISNNTIQDAFEALIKINENFN